MNVFDWDDIDLFAVPIHFLVKGNIKLNSFLGSLISLIIFAFFVVVLVFYIVFNSSSQINQQIDKLTNYSMMTNSESLFSQVSKSAGYVFEQVNATDNMILLTTEWKQILDNYDVNNIYTSNAVYANADILLMGFLIVNKSDESLVPLENNGFLNLEINLEKYQYKKNIAEDLEKGNSTLITSEYQSDGGGEQSFTFNEVLLETTKINDFSISPCSKFYDNNLMLINSTLLNFTESILNYPFLKMFNCLENLNINFSKPYKPNFNMTKYMDYKLNLNFEICYSEINPNCLYPYSTLLPKLNQLEIYTYILNRKYKSKTQMSYLPYLKSFNFNYNYTKQYLISLQSNYFYDMPVNMFTGGYITPFFSSVDLFELKSETIFLGKTRQISVLDQTTGLYIPKKSNTIFKIQITIKDEIRQVFYFYEAVKNGVGIMGNLIFLLYFIGKLFYFLLNKDKNMDYIMNEVMVIVDPKNQNEIDLLEQVIVNYKVDDDENNIIVQKKDYLLYNELAKEDPGAINSTYRHDKSSRGLLTNNTTDHVLSVKNSTNMPSIKKEKKKPKFTHSFDAIENMIKANENLIFIQTNRYYKNKKFVIGVKDKLKPGYKEIRNTYRLARETLFTVTNFTNMITNLHTFKFIFNRLLFNDYQGFVIKFLSTHIFIGDYVIGYSLDHFYSRFHEKREWEIQLERFRRAIAKLRKNGKFRKYDKKLIELYKFVTQQNLTESFILMLKDYFKQKT
jgi:hypothetical protein